MSEKTSTKLSPTFCVLPWLHLGVRPTGRLRVCTWTISTLKDGEGRPYSVGKDSLFSALNCSELDQMKAKMLAGKTVAACTRCYEFESVGNRSKRQTELEVNAARVPDILTGKVQNPEILELRLGNKCNLGCVSCSPDSSSFLYREIEQNMEKKDVEFDDQHLGAFASMRSSMSDWYEREEFWQDVRQLMPEIRRLYITGGEPTLIGKNWEMLSYAIAQGYASQIDLEMSTNLTVIKEEQIETLNHFKSCHVYCSIDATDGAFEYLRYPARWDKVESNFRRLLQIANANVQISVTPTISALSIWRLKDLYAWLSGVENESSRGVRLHCHTLLRDPAYQSLTNLPPNLKQKAIGEVEALLAIYPDEFNQRNLSKVANFIRHGESHPEILIAGQKFIETFDNIRGRSWREFVPELGEVWR
ncbi:MAG: radical SAM protein [Bdellovibrionaceae bacterium]|nr:radical SAM protein [Bdellovibrionales bacterium]MCB9086149.1 radical SAM protein [Pseudobdellovibrionaceae bacterium]